ncbi:hypothetical protein KR038_005322, partial [Drosophila bunnanda]
CITESCSQASCGDTMTCNSNSKATQIAKEAAEEAKAANEALAAASQNASYQVQLLLADKAMTAASTASSLVEAKQAIVDRFAKEIQQAEAEVAQLGVSLNTSEANVNATCAALTMVDNHPVAMQVVADEIKSGLEELDILVKQCQADLKEQKKFLAKALEHGDRLCKQYTQVSAEYENIKNSTCRAVSAALEAKLKVSPPSTVAASPPSTV